MFFWKGFTFQLFTVLTGFVFLSACKEEAKVTLPQGNTRELFKIKETQQINTLSLLEGSSNLLKADLCFEIEIPFFQGKEGTFDIVNKPDWATFDSKKGKLSGCPVEPGLFSNIKFQVKVDSTPAVESQAYEIKVIGDPLSSFSWHLRNTGQTSFAKNGGVSGEDMKIYEAIKLGLTGERVKIAVSDSGLEIAHEDLVENILTGRSKNYFDGTDDPTTSKESDRGDHGTSVGGIIAATGWNNKGSRGVAPGAKLVGLNMLHPKLSVTNATKAFYDQAQQDLDIVNQSWGTDFRENGVPEFYWARANTYYEALLDVATRDFRGERGTVFVKAAGNFYPYDAAFDPDQRNPYKIVVGALNSLGTRASYSATGANLWVSGLAGEFGLDKDASKIINSTQDEEFFFTPTMVTTDRSSCEVGYSRRSLKNTLLGLDFFGSFFNYVMGENAHSHPLNPDCNYTSTFNGTSAAAPSISGVIALMLEQNPNLTWRDVKHILAATSDKVDADDKAWIKNKAGFLFNRSYGFGRGNAKAAVEMAAKYQVDLGKFESEEVIEKTLSENISEVSNAPTQRSLSIASSSTTPNLVIESVVVRVEINHPNPHQLSLVVQSPSGTESVLLDSQTGSAKYSNIPQISFLTNAFYGEESVGSWKLKILDKVSSTTGTLKSWGVKVYGHRP